MSLNNKNLNNSNENQNNDSYKGKKDLSNQNIKKTSSEDENLEIKGHDETKNEPFGRPIEEIAEDSKNDKFKQLPNELKAKGWLLNENILKIPVPNSEYYLTIECRVIVGDYVLINEFCYWWSTKNSKKGLHTWYKKFFNEYHKPRNEFLKRFKPKDLELDETFLTDLEIIQNLVDYDLETTLEKNYKKLNGMNEEDEPEDDEERFKYPNFESYPEPVQKEATKIHKEGRFLKLLVYSTSVTHQGDTRLIKNNNYSYASLFLKEPVHKFNSGDTGTGKTDLNEESMANIPDQYVTRLRTVSPKYIYYDKDNFHPLYNILCFDDYKETEDSIEVVKEFSDNKKNPKELKTVSKDRKAETYTLGGHWLTEINSAKQLSDTEFLNRFFLEDIDNKETHKTKVKNKIKNNEVFDMNNSLVLEKLRFTLKCAWQYLIDKEIKVFNPYILFLDVNNINNRNIKGYMSYIKSRSFFFYEQRNKINNTVIGTFEDFNYIAKNIQKKAIKQNYKLTGLQEEIINILPVYKVDKVKNIQKKAIDNLEGAKQDENTYDKLAKRLGKSKTTIMNAVNGIKGSSNPSLIDLGFVNRTEFQPDTHRRDMFLYKSEESEKSFKKDIDTEQVVYKENKLIFNTLKKKIVLIYSFITNHNILINTQLNKKINQFIEKHPESLNSDEKIFNFLNDFMIEHEKDFVEITEDEYPDTESKMFHLKEISKYQKNDKFFISLAEDPENMISTKSKETATNKKQNSKNQFKNKINPIVQDKNSNKESNKYIHKNIYETLQKHGKLTTPEFNKYCDRLHDDLTESMRIMERKLEFLVKESYLDYNEKTKRYQLTSEFADYYKKDLEELKHEN